MILDIVTRLYEATKSGRFIRIRFRQNETVTYRLSLSNQRWNRKLKFAGIRICQIVIDE